MSTNISTLKYLHLSKYKRLCLSPKSLSSSWKLCGRQLLQWLHLPVFAPCVLPPLEDELDQVTHFWCIAWGKREEMWHPTLDSKRLYFLLALSFAHSDEVSCHLVNALWRGPCGKELREPFKTTFPTTGKVPISMTGEKLNPANHPPSEPRNLLPLEADVEPTAAAHALIMALARGRISAATAFVTHRNWRTQVFSVWSQLMFTRPQQ